jgi:hypothetical protein
VSVPVHLLPDEEIDWIRSIFDVFTSFFERADQTRRVPLSSGLTTSDTTLRSILPRKRGVVNRWTTFLIVLGNCVTKGTRWRTRPGRERTWARHTQDSGPASPEADQTDSVCDAETAAKGGFRIHNSQVGRCAAHQAVRRVASATPLDGAACPHQAEQILLAQRKEQT